METFLLKNYKNDKKTYFANDVKISISSENGNMEAMTIDNKYTISGNLADFNNVNHNNNYYTKESLSGELETGLYDENIYEHLCVPREENNKMNVYDVFILDAYNGRLISKVKDVTAKDTKEAEFNADVHSILKNLSTDWNDVKIAYHKKASVVLEERK